MMYLRLDGAELPWERNSTPQRTWQGAGGGPEAARLQGEGLDSESGVME